MALFLMGTGIDSRH